MRFALGVVEAEVLNISHEASLYFYQNCGSNAFNRQKVNQCVSNGYLTIPALQAGFGKMIPEKLSTKILEFGTISLGARSNRVGNELFVSLFEENCSLDSPQHHIPVAKPISGGGVFKAISSLGSI
jgi:hypothetical protein